MIAAVAIYSALMVTMMKYTFSFITKIPDQLMKWMGGGHGSGLAEAGGAGSAVEHQSGAAVGAVTGAVAGAATSKLNTMAHRGEKQPKKNGAEKKAGDAAADQNGMEGLRMAEQCMFQKEAAEKQTEVETERAFGDPHGDNPKN